MIDPKVSICMPLYRGAAFLPQAIESILGQKFDDFELLIIDDCSSDGTLEIVEEYARRDSRVVCQVNSRNLGMVPNWNQCLYKARGKYIKYLFQDDVIISTDCLGKMVNVLDVDDTVSLVATGRRVIDLNSNLIRVDSFCRFPFCADGREVIRYCILKHGNIIGEPSAVLFRREQALRGFNSAYRQIVDLEMWFHLLEQGKMSYLNEPLCGFRVHQEQQTQKNSYELAHIEDFNLLFLEYLQRDYMRLGSLTRWYVAYHQFYEIWKLSRLNRYNQQLAFEKISRYYGNSKFRVLLPFYKLCHPIFKLRRSLMRRNLHS